MRFSRLSKANLELLDEGLDVIKQKRDDGEFLEAIIGLTDLITMFDPSDEDGGFMDKIKTLRDETTREWKLQIELLKLQKKVKQERDLEDEMRKAYILPNYYVKEHFDEMEDWSDEKFEQFKEFMSRQVCNHDPFREIVSEYIEQFNDENM